MGFLLCLFILEDLMRFSDLFFLNCKKKKVIIVSFGTFFYVLYANVLVGTQWYNKRCSSNTSIWLLLHNCNTENKIFEMLSYSLIERVSINSTPWCYLYSTHLFIIWHVCRGRGKSLLELWVTTFLPGWQPPLIFIWFTSKSHEH